MDERKLKASWLDARGKTAEAIAQEIGVSVRTIFRWQKSSDYQRLKLESCSRTSDEIEKAVRGSANEELASTFGWAERRKIVDQEVSDLARWTNALNAYFEASGDTRAIDKLLRIQERRAKLLGLDAIRPADILTSAIALAQLGLLSDAKLDRIFQIYDDVPGKLAQITDQ